MPHRRLPRAFLLASKRLHSPFHSLHTDINSPTTTHSQHKRLQFGVSGIERSASEHSDRGPQHEAWRADSSGHVMPSSQLLPRSRITLLHTYVVGPRIKTITAVCFLSLFLPQLASSLVQTVPLVYIRSAGISLPDMSSSKSSQVDGGELQRVDSFQVGAPNTSRHRHVSRV